MDGADPGKFGVFHVQVGVDDPDERENDDGVGDEINLIHEDEVAEIGQGVGVAFLQEDGGKEGSGGEGGFADED